MKDYKLDPELIRACGVVQALINLGTLIPVLSRDGREFTKRWIESYLDTLLDDGRVGKRPLSEHEAKQLMQIGIAILSMLNHKEND